MSSSTVKPEKTCESEIQLQPLEDPVHISAIQTLMQLIKTSLGPEGKLKLIQNATGGHVTITSSSIRLLCNISIRNQFLRLIVAAVKSHLSLYSDGGLFCALLALKLLDNSLKLPYPKPTVSELNDYFAKMYCEHIQRPESNCAVKLDFSDLSQLLSVVGNIIASKPACSLTDHSKRHVSLTLLKAFLNAVPSDPTNDQNVPRITFFTQEGPSPTESKLFNGMLLSYSEVCDKTYTTLCTKLKNSSCKTLKIALFTTSLSGDAKFQTNHLEVSGISVWNEVLDYLKQFAAKLLNDGTDIVACQKVVHPLLRKEFENKNILVLERLGADASANLQHISGAAPVASLSVLSSITYGSITCCDHVKIGKKKFLLIQNEHKTLWTVLLCNYNEEALEETKVVSKQAVDTLYRLLKQPMTCFGGGCTELQIAAILEKNIKDRLLEVANEVCCSRSQVLESLENFIDTIIEVAVTVHQGSKLLFATEEVHHHLWKLKCGNFPSGKSLCMCGCYSAETIGPSQWHMFDKGKVNNPNVYSNTKNYTEASSNKILILDELSARVNACKVSFQISSLILKIGLSIRNKN